MMNILCYRFKVSTMVLSMLSHIGFRKGAKYRQYYIRTQKKISCEDPFVYVLSISLLSMEILLLFGIISV